MKKFLYLSLLGIIEIVVLLVGTPIAHAETLVQGVIYGDVVWAATGSPYVLHDDVVVPEGSSLTIGPGVSVGADPAHIGEYGIDVEKGSLNILGSGSHRVSVSGISGISATDATVSVANADLVGSGFYFENSLATIASSTVSGTSEAIHDHDSEVHIWGSQIFNNSTGVYYFKGPIVSVRRMNTLGIGGIGNALDSTNGPIPGIDISGSSIFGNTKAVNNLSTTSIDAPSNWWGSAAGPTTSGSNRINGQVSFTPWLSAEPALDPGSDDVCCSSIVFIPGMEGSRLYDGTSGFLLWEPLGNGNITNLYLAPNGSSTNHNVESGDPIDSAYGLASIYGSFMKFLDRFVTSGTIGEWKSFGYDWRKPIQDVVLAGEKRATSTESLVETVLGMAKRSRTGKVTIVAHSNGGLVAKYLVKTLHDMGEDSIIDTVISVAVPYLGTPSAIAAILHGDDQSIFGGILASAPVMRGLGSNMPSAYSLLPSASYFTDPLAILLGPTIAFASTTIPGINPATYPQRITTQAGENSFVADSGNARKDPLFADTVLPSKGNSALLQAADILHDALDAYIWPVDITRYALVGWNRTTTKSVVYDVLSKCWKSILGMSCGNLPTHFASTTLLGDGTVVVPSATYNSGEPVSIDLHAASGSEGVDISHANILESSSTENAIAKIITHGGASDTAVSLDDELNSIPGVHTGLPQISGEPSFLELSTHSPVNIDVYDEQGRHTGLIPLPPELNATDSPFMGRYENKIPGSRFENIGGTDDDPEYQIYLPDDVSQKYSVALTGTGLGEFTYDIDHVKNGAYTDKVEFASMPVTPLTLATTSLRIDPTVTTLLASSTGPLAIDVDGNGTPDVIANSKTEFDPLAYLEFIKTTINSLAGTTVRGKSLVKRVNHLEDLVRAGKLKQTHNAAARLAKRFGNKKLKKISDQERSEILDLIDLFLAQFE